MCSVTHSHRQYRWKILPRLHIKLARNRSSSRTVTVIWLGKTHRVWFWQCCDLPRRSPSVLSNGMPRNKITITKSSLHTLSAWRRQSIRLIFPFWSGLEITQRHEEPGLFPTTDITKSSLHSCRMSFRSFAKSLEAHFCFTSGASASSSSLHLLSSSGVIRTSCFL